MSANGLERPIRAGIAVSRYDVYREHSVRNVAPTQIGLGLLRLSVRAALNSERPHSGKYCFGKTPMQTFLDSRQLAWDKILDLEAPATAAFAC